MQEHPWLDRLYVKLALQVKKTEQKTKKLALIELKMQKKKSRKPGELTPATRSSGWACRWIMELETFTLEAGLYSRL